MRCKTEQAYAGQLLADYTHPLLVDRYMVWTDCGGGRPRLERADMDGSNRHVLVSDHVGWPNGIALDTHTRRVVWADAKTEVSSLSLSLPLSLCLCVCVCVCVCVCLESEGERSLRESLETVM